MLSKLALKNIKKSIKDYSIYFFTLVVAIIIFYSFNSLEAQESMLILSESKKDIVQALIQVLNYVSIFITIILGFLIVYSNNFLIKRRKKEFGLYLTLGMSKTKVSTILVLETILVGLLSLGVGLFLGMFVSQFLSIFTAKLFEADMSSFKFIFSKTALLKTVLYFGIIYLLVMIFNVISISKHKLINLLNAKKQNEKVKFRNKYVIIITFLLSMSLLIYAYKLLFDGVLFTMNSKVLYMLIAGALGTYLFFFSVSGFFLKIFQLIRKIYYKDLNMFILKQINSRLNTTVLSTTVISLMLLLTIGILSGSLSIVNIYNGSLNENNRTDFTIISNDYNCVVNDPDEGCKFEKNNSEVLKVLDLKEFKDNVQDYVYYNEYVNDNITMTKMIDKKTREKLIKDYGASLETNQLLSIISETDYNNILKLFKDNDKIDLSNNEYILTSSVDKITELYESNYKKGLEITVNGYKLKPKTENIKSISFQNFAGPSNYGTIIVSDEVADGLLSENQFLIGNYIGKDKEKIETDLFDSIEKSNLIYIVRTKINMQNSSIGIKAIITFVGLYLGIVFAISSATVLAIGQLSEASDNKERYLVLKQIGCDEKLIKKSLFIQIMIAFMIPLFVALFHAFFGLRELNKCIELLGEMDLTNNILLTTLFIVFVYGGYFIITYLCSKTIIKDN